MGTAARAEVGRARKEGDRGPVGLLRQPGTGSARPVASPEEWGEEQAPGQEVEGLEYLRGLDVLDPLPAVSQPPQWDITPRHRLKEAAQGTPVVRTVWKGTEQLRLRRRTID